MTIRFKLTLWFVAVLLLANSVLSLLMLDRVEQVWTREVQHRVQLDLVAARAEYQNRGDAIAAFLEGAALSSALAGPLQSRDSDALHAKLATIPSTRRRDLLAIFDDKGHVVSVLPEAFSGQSAFVPLVQTVLREGAARTGTVRVSAERADGDKLFLAAAVPIPSADERLAGVLVGGELLNGRNELADTIRRRVLTAEEFEGRPVATVTLFLDDRRIATNVLHPDGTRALGTRLSQEVYETVFVRGETWSAPAQVLDEWHFTAYEPIRDPDGQIVGAIYVGLLREPFLRERNARAIRFLLMITGTTFASLGLLLLVAVIVLRPVSKIVRMARRVVAGDLTARVGIRPSGELGVLCRAIDAMADAVAERERRLEVATRQQIGRSEKLASIGRLAAGIAHEINNPLTGVLTLAHLLREKENMDEQDRQDLEMIIQETTRTSEIVRGLLDFARERPARKERLDLNDTVQRTVRLLRGQKPFGKIKIMLELDEHLPDIDGDVNQLQQVLVNLALNASAAMPEGGTLLVGTFTEADRVVLRFSDTGSGIQPQHLDKIFDPFFTTKPVGEGTGLGLSVSYGIVEQHGGTIEVESVPGKGTSFTIVLPAADIPAGPAFPDASPDWGL